ncbi:hypothetical protein H4R19_004773 [Coemansia spiralis]|nr:hypothetical protein H4R19_004773 [Coemansia spiralis]
MLTYATCRIPADPAAQAEARRGIKSPPVGTAGSDPNSQPPTATSHARCACFATTSRLLTCLVNEGLVDAYHIGPGGSNGAATHLLVVPRGTTPVVSGSGECLISQLRHRPVTGPPLAAAEVAGGGVVAPVLLLDPEDLGMNHWIHAADSGGSAAALVTDARQIMARVEKWNSYNAAAVAAISSELANSSAHQLYAYTHEWPCPDLLTAAAIEWEQSISEGHPTHPMHRSRYAEPPLAPVDPGVELGHLQLAFVAVPRSELRIEGALEELLGPLYAHATPTSSNDGSCRLLDHVDRASEAVLPVHPLHVPAVLAKFAFVRQLPFALPAAAQMSLRTLVPQLPEPYAFNVKLPLGIKTTSALRTVSPWSTYVGPRVTEAIPLILQGAAVDGALLIAGERASAVSVDPDYDTAKYLSCVVRDDPDHLCRPRGERAIVAAALTDCANNGVAAVVRLWGLDTEAKRRSFLQQYTDCLFDAFLPPIVNHGFAFEAHQQNALLRIDARTGELRGFLVRDFGGIMVHRPTFRASTGADIDMLPDSSTDAHSLDQVYDVAYHTLIQCHLHRLIRALGLHYRGNGWALVRRAFALRVPRDHPLRNAWLQPTVDLKCFVTMKFEGLYRHYAYRRVPNVLFYANEDEGIVFSPID